MKLFPQIVLLTAAMSSIAATALSDQEFEALRTKMLNRQRKVIYNTDGCDALYYPRVRPATREAFKGERLVHTQGTEIDSVFYCPLSSGFLYFCTGTDVGDRLYRNPPHDPNARNVTRELLEIGTDCIAIAEEYCREQNLEFFISIRVNDTHDSGTEFLFPKFKAEHPEVLFGAADKRPPFCNWSAVDFAHPLVRERMAAAMKEFCERYTFDGIEYDFMRHMQLLKSVAWGNHASQEELNLMTDFMKTLRDITEEAGRKRGRPILVAVRVPDSVDYCKAVGIDLENWMDLKLIDIMIGSSYFQLNPWNVSAEMAHRHGVKFYASLDESRISQNLPFASRNSQQAFSARALAAMAGGCDGVYYFNMEYGGLERNAFVSEKALGAKDKVYYATERGTGGYTPSGYVKGGEKLNNMPKLDPGTPMVLPPNTPYEFSMLIGDKLESADVRARQPQITAMLRTNHPEIPFALRVNGKTYSAAETKDDVIFYHIAAEELKYGMNDFAISYDKALNFEQESFDSILKGNVLLQGKNQFPWRRFFQMGELAECEQLAEGACRLCDPVSKEGFATSFFYPLPVGDNVPVHVKFDMKLEKSSEPDAAVFRIANNKAVEVIQFMEDAIGLKFAKKTIPFKTADAFHHYDVRLENSKLTLLADGKELFALDVPGSVNDEATEMKHTSEIIPGLQNCGLVIGSISGSGTSSTLWKNMELAQNTLLVHDFAIGIHFANPKAAVAQEQDEWEAKRQAALNRKRQVLYNTDGCDALYFPRKWEGTVEALKNHRLRYTQGTRIDTVLYCPICSGFGHLTTNTKVGDPLLVDPEDPKFRNVTKEIIAQGTDPLAVALEYCREQNLEFFASLRFNDTHDQGHTPEKPFFLMSPYKINHPEFLMGSREKRPPRCAWSAADFTHPEVRQHQADMIREICTNYDLDGIEYDFMRHMQLLKSVAWDGEASEEELDMMTGFLRELRGITEEIGHKRGRPILVAVRVPDSIGYCRAVGIDIERWLQEKLFDIEIASGYFQLNKWRTTATLAHKYGAKFYASLDESRISQKNAISGRGTPAFYYARIAAAMADGCDGVYHFNLEYDSLNLIGRIDPNQTEGFNKLYFATERGSGGYRSWHFLKNGDRFNVLPKLDPGEPKKLEQDKPYVFSITVGDDLTSDFAKELHPTAFVQILTNIEDSQRLVFACNGQVIRPRTFFEGSYAYDIPISLLVKGENEFWLTLKDGVAQKDAPVIRDFVLKIDYKEGAPKELVEIAEKGEITKTYMTITAKDGKLETTGKLDNTYNASCMKPEDDGVRLIHNAGGNLGYQCVTCKDPEFNGDASGVLLAKWCCKAIECDNGEACFQVAFAPGPKNGNPFASAQVVEVPFRLFRNRVECGLGEVNLHGAKLANWNEFALAVDINTRIAVLLINGKVACHGLVQLGGGRDSGFCHVGDASGSVSGIVGLKYFTMGKVK